MNNMLTIEEVKSYLAIEQRELEQYLERGKLHAYKIGGTFLRFRKEDVVNLRCELTPGKDKLLKHRNIVSVVGDFWRFNNFYILSLVFVICAVVWMIIF